MQGSHMHDTYNAAILVSDNGYYNSKFTTVSYLGFPLQAQKFCTLPGKTILFFSYILIYNGKTCVTSFSAEEDN